MTRKSDERREVWGSGQVIALALATFAAIALSALVWDYVDAASVDLGRARSGGHEAAGFVLFGLSGLLGGLLRSLAYLLAIRSFTPREYAQWKLEAVIGPSLGIVSGLISYVAVSALLAGPAGVSTSGMYLVALAIGATALPLFGRTVERGILRGGLSRSGIMGAEVSPSVPLLSRLEGMLEQRLADLTVVNYDGRVEVSVGTEDASGTRVVDVWFDPGAGLDDPGRISTAQLAIAGGIEREHVTFSLSILTQNYASAPLLLTMTVPRRARSESGHFVLQRLTDMPPGTPVGSAIVEISQGTQTVSVVPVRMG